MTTHRPEPIRHVQHISGPAELLQAVPYLLGFHPARSLVLVGLDAGRLVVTARVDLTDAGGGAVAHTLAAMARGGARSFIAIVFDDEPPGLREELPWLDLTDSIRREGTRVGGEVLDALLVARGRWWSLMCAGADCCPPDGRELPAEPSAFAAAATYAGIVALPDRAALEALLEPVPEVQRDGLAAAIGAAEDAAVQQALEGHTRRFEAAVKRALFAAARAADEPGWDGLPDDDRARFAAALSGHRIRDAVWMAIDDGRLDGRPLWRDLARRLPGPYAAAPLFLFGWAAWRSGDGTLAGLAAERAVAADPGYSAADLLLAALTHGLDPRRLPRLRLPRPA